MRHRVPGISEELADQVARIVPLVAHHRPAQAAVGVRDPRLGPDPRRARDLLDDATAAKDSLHILLKYREDDIDKAAKELLSASEL